MPVPLLDVKAQNLPLHADLLEAFRRVLESGAFIGGPAVEGFEKECAVFLGAEHAIGCSSGTDAILLALMALGVGPGDEVIMPAFTFFATAGCVSRTGASPVFVDVCPVGFNIDTESARKKITSRTKAIMPVHLFGQCADMDSVQKLAQEHGLSVIEDAAQAFGAAHRGRKAGTMGQFGAYSFFPSKNLGGLGDSGLLVTNDAALAEKARLLRNHGAHPKYYHQYIGANFRLDAVQAALLSVKLAQYSSYTERRSQNAAYYTSRLSSLSGVATAQPTDKNYSIVLPSADAHNQHIWNQYTLRVLNGKRDALRDHLLANGVGCEIYYPLTLDQQECFRNVPESARMGCDVAHRMAAEVLSIPVYPELTRPQLDEVIAAIASFLEAQNPN
jgi:dTDP-4-amino-4,6-dideoxygalactose transaminase